jgi:chromate transport protein ChrA
LFIALATMAAASIATALGVVVLILLLGVGVLLATRTSERALDIVLMLSLAFLAISYATEDPSVIRLIVAGLIGLYAARIAWTLWQDRDGATRNVPTS